MSTKKENSFNTDGFVDVALFNESFILPVAREYGNIFDDDLANVLIDAFNRLAKRIREMKASKDKSAVYCNYDNYRFHLNAYKRMLKNLEKTLSYFDDVETMEK